MERKEQWVESNVSKHDGNILVFFNTTIHAYFGMMHVSAHALFPIHMCMSTYNKKGVHGGFCSRTAGIPEEARLRNKNQKKPARKNLCCS